jgi:hypothetical protein
MLHVTNRKEARRRISVPVEWCKRGAATRTRSTAENISEDGLFVKTALPLRPGTEVELILRLKKGTLAAIGTVKWATEMRGMGLTIRPAID